MTGFALRLTLFCLPIAAVLSFPLYVFVASQEYVTADAMVARSAESARPFRYGPAYSNPVERYKLRMALMTAPDVLVLGSSRVLQFRSFFFKPDVRFYNAGRGGMVSVRHFRLFLDRIPKGQEPKLIFAGFDHSFFNEKWDRAAEYGYDDRLNQSSTPLSLFFRTWVSIYADYFRGKFRLSDLRTAAHDGRETVDRVGLVAVLEGAGYRRDGSRDFGDPRYHGEQQGDGYEQGFARTMAWLDIGHDRFPHGRTASARALEEVAAFLQAARERGITVAGYLPPLPHVVYSKMMSMPDEFGYFRELPAALGQVFGRYGQPLLDFSDVAVLGASDREMLDAFHESEKATLRLVIAMAKESGAVRQYCDLPFLESVLRRTQDDHYVSQGDVLRIEDPSPRLDGRATRPGSQSGRGPGTVVPGAHRNH
jgi:hypothetical protein